MALTASQEHLPDSGQLAERPILIGFANAVAAPETAWSLIEAGAEVVAFTRRGSRPALRRSRAIRIVEITPPEEDLRRALTDLRAIGVEGGFGAVMPLDDTAVLMCDAAFAQTELSVIGPTGALAAFALDKRAQLKAAARAGFDVPPTRCVTTVRELEQVSDFPLVMKSAHPVAATGDRLGKGTSYVCGNRAELDAAARSWDGNGPLLVQPMLSGSGEGLFGLAGPGGPMAMSAHRRIRMMNPSGSGSSACVSIKVDNELARAASRFLGDMGWTGMFMLEFLRAADGTAWFMELNGRPWGSMALARRLGLEYPAWALRQLTDEYFRPPQVTPGEGQTCRHLGRELVHLLAVLRGPRSAAVTDWPSRWQTARAVLRVSRDDHWYNSRRGDRRLFVEDSWRTVASRLASKAGT
jgi:predicted ATP-grasp superfamily ATP-dependent carboligase